MIHELKTINPFFQEVWDGNKTFEVRRNDRNFQVGDDLWLKEYCPKSFSFSGRSILAKAKYILSADDFPDGIKYDYVAIAIDVIEKRENLP